LEASPAFAAFDILSRMFSPYQLNPANWNPLRKVLEESVDFERLRANGKVKLFLSETNVQTGKARIFKTCDVTPDVVLASVCLPFMFQAVEIEGEPYWDGGYMGNPAIYPLIYNCGSRDVVIVHINPLKREGTPKTAQEILNRINEISFNSSLMREMRVIHFVTKLIDEGKVADGDMKRMLVHSISDDEMMGSLSVTSKLNGDWEFLTHLRDAGRARAGQWLEGTFDHLGKKTTVDFATYL
jgi:NTE family protein